MHFLRRHLSFVAACAFLALVFVDYHLLFSPPSDFPSGSVAVIARGTTAPEIADQLANEHLIAHASLLRFMLRAAGASTQVRAGAYRFNAPQNLFIITYRLITGDYGIPPTRITLFEGQTVRDAAATIAKALPEISEQEFLAAGQPYEGYLFPDTYLFPPSIDAEGIVGAMRINFNTKIASSTDAIGASGHSLSDIITMASLIEKEARSTVVKHMVAGILWNRFKLGMPLQVDAVFGYIYSRDTYSPSLADLKVDSPYNTYTHTGLPPGPIDNPGLDSIDAALHPTKTNYLYYLTDKNGVMHYAATFAQHQANQQKYLR